MEKKLKSGGFAVEVEELPQLWHDRKRHFGLPWSFTSYSLNADKLLINTGLFNLKEDEILLYRIRDISVSQSLWERIFGVGTVCLTSSDSTLPHLDLQHVKDPRKVKEVLSKCVESSRRKNGIRSTELMSGMSGVTAHGPAPLTGDMPLPEELPVPEAPDENQNGVDDRTEG